MQATESISNLTVLEQAHVATACLIYPCAVWFIALYTDLIRWRRWVISATAAFGVLLALEMISPYGLLLSHLVWLPESKLPWGELVRQFTGLKSQYAWMYYFSTGVFFLWSIQRCWIIWNNGQRERAVPFAAYLLLQLIAVLDAEYNTITGSRSIDWDMLPFLVMVLLISRSLTRELHLQTEVLADTVEDLRNESIERSRIQDNLHYLAYHDELTGLPNRRALDEYIGSMTTRKSASDTYGVLIVIDIDHFKNVNDALGYDVGDQVLRAVALRLEKHYPDARCLARIGGDEYALLLTVIASNDQIAESTATRIAKDLSCQLAGPFHLGEHELITSVSLGLALHPGPTSSTEDLLRHANLALHRVKTLARGQAALFSKAMDDDAERRLVLERGLRSQSIGDQLNVEYQPQLDGGGRLVGAEVLLRWRHPELGEVRPQEFVAVAEEAGLIHMLGRQVLRRTCESLSTWQARGLPAFRVAINISPWQIALPDFVEMVVSEIEKSGADPRWLTLEITESTFIREVDEVAAKIRQLDAAGIWVAIDDFGTGYASIATLKRLPVRELKIDQNFVRDMRTDSRDGIVESMISLAHAMNLHIVAEGIETEAQYAALVSMGCDAFQGYLISRPLDEQTFDIWLQNHGNS